MEWIDYPVGYVIDYFVSTASSFMTWAVKLGTLIGLLGVCWSCVKLAFGTLEPQKAIVGTMMKFIMFTAILNLYPETCRAVQRIAISMGREAAPGVEESIKKQMGDLAKYLDARVRARLGEMDYQAKMLSNEADRLRSQIYFTLDGQSAAEMQLDGINRKTRATLEKRTKYANENADLRTVDAILSVLSPVDENGNPTDINLTSRYVLKDMALKDMDGNPTQFLSPNAMLKIGILSGNVMWEKMFTDLDSTKKKKDLDTGSPKGLTVAGFPVYRLFDIILLFICRITIIVAMLFAVLQYVMCVVEFTIVVSVSVLCVPCMLMDELHDMAQRVLPSILAQAMKLTLITMSMYFCMWLFLDFTTKVITENTEFNLSTFAYVLFSIFLAFVITQSAPRIAVAIMTGQPQLSMGELVVAMGTAATMGTGAAMAAATAATGMKKSVPTAARAGVDAVAGIRAINAAGMATRASAMSRGERGIGGIGIGSYLRGATGETGYRVGQGFKSTLSNIAHSGVKGGSASGQGSFAGINRFSLENDSMHSANYGRATKEINGKQVSMTASEFIGASVETATARANARDAKRQARKGFEFSTKFVDKNT